MRQYTIGPVDMEESVRAKGAEQIPYFRTKEFSRDMLQMSKQFLALLSAPEGAAWIPLTASGTGAMEAVVMNVLRPEDKCLVIDGGTFGHRFVQLCERHGVPHESLCVPFGTTLVEDMLSPYEGKGFTALLVNIDETSTAQLYDYRMLGDFCRRNGILYIADAISSFLADEFRMDEAGVDVVITASQKAIALPPGMSFVALSEGVLKERIGKKKSIPMYFDFADALINMERGQTPFTPAVGTLMQLRLRLEEITRRGIEAEIATHRERALHFRELCRKAEIPLPEYPMSNAVTAVLFPEGNALEVLRIMREEYGEVLTPNGGELADTVLRVGHLGARRLEDYDLLVQELREVLAR